MSTVHPEGTGDDLADAYPDKDEALRAAGEAVGMLSCPYYNGVGICGGGCHSEPSCQTGEPSEGWEGQLLNAAEWLVRAAGPTPEATR